MLPAVTIFDVPLRLYRPMPVSGVVAGHSDKTKKLGFVAAKRIPQVLRDINGVPARRAVGRSVDYYA
ncbi:hypothetical protein OKW41_001625 [Paraburkholderia sp. UCT70]